MPGGGGPGEIAGAGDSTAAPHPQNEPADQLCYVWVAAAKAPFTDPQVIMTAGLLLFLNFMSYTNISCG